MAQELLNSFSSTTEAGFSKAAFSDLKNGLPENAREQH